METTSNIMNVNTDREPTWQAVFRLWPIIIAIVGGIIFSIRQEGRINVLQEKVNNQVIITDHLTRAGEGIKLKLDEQAGDMREIKTIVIRLDKKIQ